jgi:sortase A
MLWPRRQTGRVAGKQRDEQQPRSRWRHLVWVGVAMIVAGVLVLGYVGWQLYGTTWASKREQKSIVGATERVWQQGEGQGSVSAEDQELADDVVALIRIPRLGEEYVVPAHEGTDDDTLTRGFGVFGSSPAPGGKGNFALAGHRITHGEPLREMPDLDVGDEVVVETRDTVYTYVLDTAGDSLTVDFDAGWVTAPDPVDPETGQSRSDQVGSTRLLTLVTCAELFHTDDRLVAFGHLVSKEPKDLAR